MLRQLAELGFPPVRNQPCHAARIQKRASHLILTGIRKVLKRLKFPCHGGCWLIIAAVMCRHRSSSSSGWLGSWRRSGRSWPASWRGACWEPSRRAGTAAGRLPWYRSSCAQTCYIRRWRRGSVSVQSLSGAKKKPETKGSCFLPCW